MKKEKKKLKKKQKEKEKLFSPVSASLEAVIKNYSFTAIQHELIVSKDIPKTLLQYSSK